MRSIDQVKALSRNIAKEEGIDSMLVLRNYFLERFLERVSCSEYRSRFIVKGGFLISSMIGVGKRTTMDIDATLRSVPMTEDSIKALVEKLRILDVGDGVSFDVKDVYPIREEDSYGGFRAELIGHLGKIAIPVKLDFSTGDVITPGPVEYSHAGVLGDAPITILAYNLSTVLAEKLETIVSRGAANTRARDFYDVYALGTVLADEIDIEEAATALINTSSHRGTVLRMDDWRSALKDIPGSPEIARIWRKYQGANPYAAPLSIDKAIKVAESLLAKMEKTQTWKLSMERAISAKWDREVSLRWAASQSRQGQISR